MTDCALRPGEITTPLPDAPDAHLFFIGRIRTPWARRDECPRRGDLDGPECRIDLFDRWAEALQGVETAEYVQVLYWMHLARRDLVLQRPRAAGGPIGSFALRSPVRPNPIASSRVRLIRRDGGSLLVRGLDCVDGTPLLDVKPERCPVLHGA